MGRKNSEKNKKNSMKQAPSATGVRLTRLVQAVAMLAAVKLAAICLLWMPPALPQNPLLQPVVIRPALAAGQALAASQALAAELPQPGGTAQNSTSQNPTNASAAEPASQADQLQDLNARQLALDKKEAELRTLERELDEKLTTLRELEIKMQKLIDSAGTIQDEKMVHLIDVYSNMKPKQAAQVLETLEEPIAVRILAGMSGRKAGEILSSVRPDRAAKLSEALTRLQTGGKGN